MELLRVESALKQDGKAMRKIIMIVMPSHPSCLLFISAKILIFSNSSLVALEGERSRLFFLVIV